MKETTEAERWRRVDALLQAALERAPAEQSAFLDAACAGDAALRAEVESLLGYRADAEHFIEAPAFALAAGIFPDGGDGGADSRAEGRQIGPYKVIREIGRGGMGAVFLAERSDGEFSRRVALKVVRRGLAGPESARRFRRERQILASLEHPNIARLLDGGVSADGEPYFVMEYVEGARVDDYCDARSLPVGARLRLFLSVCSAVAYAHQHLVVHRDIKPSNILVTPEGVPKLLDFGIAKLLDAEHADERTQTEFRAFTPEYASPEQVRGDPVTTASDVYSLGVLLQNLLHGAATGKQARPGGWRGQSGGDARETVAANLPTADDVDEGSRRARETGGGRVGAELRNITAMARREEPARRYGSVAQLADDVQRYLDGLPVRAQKDTFRYRAGKFVRRHKAAAVASAAVAVALVAGLALALWQAGVARRERDRAERRFADVRQLSNALLTDIAPKIERLQGSTEARQSVVTQSLKYLDSLAREAADDPALQSELASAYEKVGDLQGNPTNPSLNALTDALASYEKANAMRRALLEKSPHDFEQRRLLANNHRALGDIRWQTNEQAESLKNSEAALSLYAELLAERPDSPELRLALARTNLDIGKVFATNEKYPESISSFQKAVALLEEERRRSPDGVEVSTLLAEAHKQVGNSLSWEGQQREAEAEVAKAVAMSEALVAAHPDDARLRTALQQTYIITSSVYEDVNDALSNEYAFKALRVIEDAAAKDPANLRARQQLAKAHSRVGVTLANVGRSAESVAHLGRAVAVLQELVQGEAKNRRFKYDLATALIRLGDARHKQRNYRDSLAALERAAAVLGELVAADANDNASLRNLANAEDSAALSHEAVAAAASGAERESRRQLARQSYRRALDILRQLEARGALSKLDRKFMERLQATVQKYER